MRCLTFVVLSLLTTPSLFPSNAEFSENRSLPPMELLATDLDKVLQKAHAAITSANGSAIDDAGARETVKLGVRGHEIEIPHFSLGSSVAFPNELFKFSYSYNQPNKPISSVIIDLGDESRRVLVTGQAQNEVKTMSDLIEKELRSFSTMIGGTSFRRVAGLCLTVTFLASLGLSGAWWWRTRFTNALGMLVCSAAGLLIILLLPWPRYLPGFALYQTYSSFLLIRYAPQIFFVILAVALVGIPWSYFVLPANGKSTEQDGS